MNKNYFGVIMAGGIGSRFWPLSTVEFPKQFHDILGTGRTFLQSTFDRLKKIIPTEQIYVVTMEAYAELTLEQLPELKPLQVITEPSGKSTAPANLLAARIIYDKDPDAVMVVAPSDHIILEENLFLDKLAVAMKEAGKNEILITLGIKPTRPETGYGYIQFIEEEKEMKKVKTFTEKPGLEIAEVLYKSGEFLWNSGIFIWKARTVLEAFEQYLPEMNTAFKGIREKDLTDPERKNIKKAYSTISTISVDHGILEVAENVYVIPSSFGWSDVGTWKSFYENMERDEKENYIKGKHILTFNTENTLVYNAENKAIIIDGLDNYVVVNTPNAILICPMEKDQYIKTYVNDLKLNKGEKFT